MSIEPSLSRASGDGLIRVSGRDARRFLHAQTTQSIDELPADATCLAAWLTAKGRIRALFDVVPDEQGFWLLLPAPMAAVTAAGLGRYVLRDQVRIEQPPDYELLTVLGSIDGWLAGLGIPLPTGRVATAPDGIRLARTGPGRVDLIVPAAAPDHVSDLVSDLRAADPAAVERDAIARGRPAVTPALVERYIPQMLDLDRQGAVSFNKGCYPGQEIVARTQNLGEVKRRLQRLRTDAGVVPAAGDAVVDSAGTVVGEVNRAAPLTAGIELLAVVATAAMAGPLRLGADGRALTPLALPWSG